MAVTLAMEVLVIPTAAAALLLETLALATPTVAAMRLLLQAMAAAAATGNSMTNPSFTLDSPSTAR